MDYQDSHIAGIYDLANPRAGDTDFYISLAGECRCSVLDLGCGTGTLCVALAERGHRVTGVDPAGAMLAVARRKPHAEWVEWIKCSAQNYRSERRFDLIIMTGHAFQVLLTDTDVLAVLATMRDHLNEGGRVAFETRNPQVDWASEWRERYRSIRVPGGVEVVETLEVTDKNGEFLSFRTSYRSQHMMSTTLSTLRFCSRKTVEALIAHAGLVIRDVFGDWNGGPFEAAKSRETIFVIELAG